MYQEEASASVFFTDISNQDIITKATTSVRFIYYSVIVGKKAIKKAVTRNRLKRLMRNSLNNLVNNSSLIEISNNLVSDIVNWKKP